MDEADIVGLYAAVDAAVRHPDPGLDMQILVVDGCWVGDGWEDGSTDTLWICVSVWSFKGFAV